MNLAMDLGREISPANYLLERRLELPLDETGDALLAAIHTGVALETWQLGAARRTWRHVLKAADRAGRTARRNGLAARGLVRRLGRVREAVELVLFDGWLPPDLAALAARTVARMAGRVQDRALCAYREEPAPGI